MPFLGRLCAFLLPNASGNLVGKEFHSELRPFHGWRGDVFEKVEDGFTSRKLVMPRAPVKNTLRLPPSVKNLSRAIHGKSAGKISEIHGFTRQFLKWRGGNGVFLRRSRMAESSHLRGQSTLAEKMHEKHHDLSCLAIEYEPGQVAI